MVLLFLQHITYALLFVPVKMFKKTAVLFLLICCIWGANQAWGQPYSWYKKPKPYTWMFGAGYSAIDDDGRGFCQPFDVNQSWNYLVFPSKLTVNRYWNAGFSADFEGTYNTYSAGKLINDSVGYSGTFLAFDLNLDYSFAQFLRPQWFEPFVEFGIGMTQRTAFSAPYCMTANANLGMNFWMYKGIGIQLQTSGKFAVIPFDLAGPNAYTQHSVSILYRIEPRQRGYSSSRKKKYKWTKARPKFKGGKGKK